MLRPKLNRLWGGSNASTRRDPTDAKYIIGWVSEIPTFQVLNYLQYKMDTTMLAQAERGVFEWGGDVTYVKGALAWDELDKQVYVSQVASPSKTLAPSNNPTQWKASSVQITRQQYDTLNANITAHIADITGNPHQLTAGRLNSYTKAETDALIAQYQALVKAHVDNKNNPHGTTAAQIGAVPITGGTYTGDVIFAAGRILLDAAGSNKVGLLSGSGLFLQSGSGVLGLNSAGVAVAGTVASQSPIVTEQTFAAQKALVEPDYASPVPIFYMPFVGDLHIYTGAGTSAGTMDFQFSAGALVCGNQTAEQRVTYSSSPLEGSVNSTIAIDVFVPATTEGTTATEFFMATGSGNTSLIIEVRKDNQTRAYGSGAATGGSTGYAALTPNVWHRIVATANPTQTNIYIDGVLAAAPSTAANNPIAGTGYNFLRMYGQAAGAGRQYKVRNLRMFNAALTAKQVSNL